jgi:hypothetical protein
VTCIFDVQQNLRPITLNAAASRAAQRCAALHERDITLHATPRGFLSTQVKK